MKLLKLLSISIVFISVFNSCQAQKGFDKELWLKNNKLLIKENPRMEMINDLMENHLKRGMDKEQIINLLGKPIHDTIGVILPKGKKLPDSLKINYNVKEADSVRLKISQKANQWYIKNYKSVKLMSYPIGWSLIDPIFLEVHINNENKVVDYWTKEY